MFFFHSELSYAKLTLNASKLDLSHPICLSISMALSGLNGLTSIFARVEISDKLSWCWTSKSPTSSKPSRP